MLPFMGMARTASCISALRPSRMTSFPSCTLQWKPFSRHCRFKKPRSLSLRWSFLSKLQGSPSYWSSRLCSCAIWPATVRKEEFCQARLFRLSRRPVVMAEVRALIRTCVGGPEYSISSMENSPHRSFRSLPGSSQLLQTAVHFTFVPLDGLQSLLQWPSRSCSVNCRSSASPSALSVYVSSFRYGAV